MYLNPNELDFSKASVIVKTLRNYERVTAQILKESFPEVKVLAEPLNFSGLVLVWSDLPAEDLAKS